MVVISGFITITCSGIEAMALGMDLIGGMMTPRKAGTCLMMIRLPIAINIPSTTEMGKNSANRPALKMLKITWVRSWIGYNKGQRETIKSLGLHRLNQTVEQPDNPQMRGQINKVKHMLEVEGL